MKIWHLTSDAPRSPFKVSPGERVHLHIGTWPIDSGKNVWVTYSVKHLSGMNEYGQISALWQYNTGSNSYWHASLGPYSQSDYVTYTVYCRSSEGEIHEPTTSFRVGSKFYLALVWHQHQPIYKDTSHPTAKGSYIHPWVRLHAIRDYYSMAALVAEHPLVNLTINLTPALLWQLEDYVERGATDKSLELTLKPAKEFTPEDQERLLSSFFDADWHNQILIHSRYKELFLKRWQEEPFSIQDLRDMQMWFNLAWFGKEFREGEVHLVTGEVASVRRFIDKGSGFSKKDIVAMIAEQYKIMRAIVPIHKKLQDSGQIEVSTTPFYHPILPLIVDTDRATIDRLGTSLPPRFAHPEDAEAQVKLAVEFYQRIFERPPRGMWPAEGAVSQSVIPIFARHGIRWIATDRGVLDRSGKWGYDTKDPNVLCQPYRAEQNEDAISIYFRDTNLSDAIGFHYYNYSDYQRAAQDFLNEIKNRFHFTGEEDRVLTVILDGENAWGSFREDARPFLHALYQLLESDIEVQTVTFGDYIEGNPSKRISSHTLQEQKKVFELFTASWIDENASAPGVDLGTWIGEQEENRGWELLKEARNVLDHKAVTPDTAPEAFRALYIAEGSDWFWWFGEDQDSGNDDEFDDLFRLHLKSVYHGIGVNPPSELDKHIVPHAVLWTFTHRVSRIQPGDRLTIRTNCPGTITWSPDNRELQTVAMVPAGGVMAGIRRYHFTLGPFSTETQEVRFVFRCTHRDCDCKDVCCKAEENTIRIF